MSKPEKRPITLPRTGKVTVNKSSQSKRADKELMRDDDGAELSAQDINNFVREIAGGNPNDVEIIPLDNVDLDGQFPFPFGNSGKTGGVRNQIQDMIAHGVNGDRRLSIVLQEASKLGHSKTRPVCLLAVLNGGYSPSSKYWGTAYAKLVHKPAQIKDKAA